MRFLSWFGIDDWKRGLRLVILWAFAYDMIIWPSLLWATTLATTFSGTQIPGPPLVPWEHLLASVGALAAVGAFEARDRKQQETPHA